MKKEKFYITTTLPYVNASPHIGFAAEIVKADTVARYQKLMGKDVFLNTGTDEHGQKIYDNATEVGEKPQAYADRYVAEFHRLIPELGISEDIHFIRTTDEHHKRAAQEMWRRCDKNGDIYKATQTINYCVGCELEKTDSELEDGKCPLHPNMKLEVREEENYFFRFSKYGDKLLALYNERSDFVLPDFRQREIKIFVEWGLRDFSVSRLKNKMPWGVPVPNDNDHVMFVWFDALTNYISTTGWPEKEDFGGWWPGVQLAGKDNLRQQSAIWQAMLMSAGLPNSKQIIVGGFINSGGHKMSKSLGNVISPYDMVKRYGADATRYILLRHVHPFDDTDLTWEKMDEYYTANLVNGLGNFVARVTKMSEQHIDIGKIEPGLGFGLTFPHLDNIFINKLKKYRFNDALEYVWKEISFGDEQIQKNKPFEAITKNPEFAKQDIANLLQRVFRIGVLLEPFMPETAKKIKEAVLANKKPENLFARLD